MNLQTNVKYIDSLNLKLDWYTDRYGNTRTLPFTNERYTINPVTHIVQLKRIPAENSSIKIEQSLSRMSGVIKPITFIEVDTITQPNHFTFDRENNIAQFHNSINGDVLIDYQAIGQFVLDAESIATAYDSKGNVIEYLSDLIRSCNNALANITVVGDLSDAIEQIKAYINSSIQLNRELNMNVNLAKIENSNLKSQVPLGQITNTQLREALLESQDSINKLTQVGGKTITITTEMWGEKQSDGIYKYRYTHNLGTMAIDISGHMLVGEVLWVAHGKKIDNNTIELWNETNDGVVVSVFARAYGGTVTTLDGFNTSHLVESPDKKYFTDKNATDLINNINQVNSLTSKVNDMTISKVDKVYVDTKIASVTNGSPKGVFETLSQLQASSTANTSEGRKYTYIVNGDWYYYNGTAWQKGGVYQSTAIAEQSVTVSHIKDGNVTLSKTDVLVAPNIQYENGFIDLEYLVGGGVKVKLVGLLLLKNRELSTQTSYNFGLGMEFVIPMGSSLVWNFKDGDSFKNEVYVQAKSVPNKSTEFIVLLQNNKDILSGSLSKNLKNNIGNQHLKDKSITEEKMADKSVGEAQIKDYNVTLSKTDALINPIIKCSHSWFKVKYNEGGGVTITLTGTVEILNRRLTRQSSFSFGAGRDFTIPLGSCLIWNFKDNGVFKSEIYVQSTSVENKSDDFVVLLQNTNDILSGLLERYIENNVSGRHILDNSISANKIQSKSIGRDQIKNEDIIPQNLHFLSNCTVHYDKSKIETTYNSIDGSVTANFDGTVVVKDSGGKSRVAVNFVEYEMTSVKLMPQQGIYLDLTSGNDIVLVTGSTPIESKNGKLLLFNNAAGNLSGELSRYCSNSIWGEWIREGSIDLKRFNKEVFDAFGGSSGDNNTSMLPTYWMNHLNNKIVEINDIRIKDRNSFSFAFLSDIHFEGSQKKNGLILKELDKGLNLSMVLNGGDSIDGGQSLQARLKQSEEQRLIGEVKDKVVSCVGNHDIINLYGSSADRYPIVDKLDKEVVYGLIIKPYCNEYQFNTIGNNMDYYRDDEVNKIRYISLFPYGSLVLGNTANIRFEKETIEWVGNTALNLASKADPEKWNVVFVCHQGLFNSFGTPKTDSPINREHMITMIDKFKSKEDCSIVVDGSTYNFNFSAFKGNILAYLFGHGHEDLMAFTPNNVPVIEITSDSNRGREDYMGQQGGLTGTYGEHSIDVYTVVPNERKMYLTKVGGTVTGVGFNPRPTVYTY